MDVLIRAGLVGLEAELERTFECQYPHATWHSENFTLFRHEPGSIRLCWVVTILSGTNSHRNWQALRVKPGILADISHTLQTRI
jgi:hypothetical protein